MEDVVQGLAEGLAATILLVGEIPQVQGLGQGAEHGLALGAPGVEIPADDQRPSVVLEGVVNRLQLGLEMAGPRGKVDGMNVGHLEGLLGIQQLVLDRKSTRLNSSHVPISYAVFC